MNEKQWVTFNTLTYTWDTGDGTKVAAEIINNARDGLDIFYIASIRERQRKEMRKRDEV